MREANEVLGVSDERLLQAAREWLEAGHADGAGIAIGRVTVEYAEFCGEESGLTERILYARADLYSNGHCVEEPLSRINTKPSLPQRRAANRTKREPKRGRERIVA